MAPVCNETSIYILNRILATKPRYPRLAYFGVVDPAAHNGQSVFVHLAGKSEGKSEGERTVSRRGHTRQNQNGRYPQHRKMAGLIVKRVRSLLSTPALLVVSQRWSRPISSSSVYCHNNKSPFCTERVSQSVLAQAFGTVSAWNGRNHVLRYPMNRILHSTSWSRGLEEFFPRDGNSIEEAEKTGKVVWNVAFAVEVRVGVFCMVHKLFFYCRRYSFWAWLYKISPLLLECKCFKSTTIFLNSRTIILALQCVEKLVILILKGFSVKTNRSGKS